MHGIDYVIKIYKKCALNPNNIYKNVKKVCAENGWNVRYYEP